MSIKSGQVHAAARYIWNQHLCAAFSPGLHFLEVSFRNALYRVGERTTRKRFPTLQYRKIQGCWLDGLVTGRKTLQPNLGMREVEEIDLAIERLGRNPKRHTPGHLIGQLGFGFWIRLCDSLTDQGNMLGPGLWPDATKAFPYCDEAANHNRGGIRAAFDEMREFRNKIAHHQPIWDKNPVQTCRRVTQLLGWMNKPLAAAVKHAASVEPIVNAGHTPYRPFAASLMSVCI